MNKKTINTIYKWTLRFYYARILLLGIVAICFSLVLMISDYKISKNEDFNLFILIITLVLGLVFLLIGLFKKVGIEHGLRKKWHEKDIL